MFGVSVPLDECAQGPALWLPVTAQHQASITQRAPGTIGRQILADRNLPSPRGTDRLVEELHKSWIQRDEATSEATYSHSPSVTYSFWS